MPHITFFPLKKMTQTLLPPRRAFGNSNYSRLILSLLLLWVVFPGNANAQALDPAFHIPEIYGEASVADAAQMPNGQYVVAGTFTRANGQVSKGLARFDAAGIEDQAFRQNLSGAAMTIQKLVPMSNGQLLVQGNYRAGAVQRNLLFRLNADGTLDPGFDMPLPNAGTLPYIDQAVVQPDGRVLVTGLYLTNGNASERNLFRVLSNGSPDPSFSATLSTASQGGSILLQPDGKILVRGDFNLISTGTRGLIRLNSDGSRDTGFQSALNPVGQQWIDCIALDANGAILVGGSVTPSATGPAQALYRLLSTGALDPSFTAPASLQGRYINQLEVLPSGQILVRAATYGVASAIYSFNNQVVKLQANGAVDATFQPGTGPDGYLWGLRALANGYFLTWGSMNNYAGQRRTVALVQPSGGLDANFAPLLQSAGSIEKIVRQADGKLVITGHFNYIDGHLTDRVARLLASGQPDVSFAWRQPRSASWTTTALAVQANGQILLAGNSSSLNTTTATSNDVAPLFTRLTTTGLPDASFAPVLTANAAVSSYYTAYRINMLAEQANGQIIVGGLFTDGAGKLNLTRLNADGSVEPTFTPVATQPIIYNGVVQADGKLICVVAGSGLTLQTIKRLLPSGAPDPAFAYIPAASAYENLQRIAQVPGTGDYVIGGVMDKATRVLARISATGAPVPGFTPPFQPVIDPAFPQSGVNVVAAQSNGKLLIGGAMRESYPYTTPATLLARLDASGQLDPTFSTSFIANPATSPASLYGLGVSDVVVQPDGAVVVGGYFSEAGGQPVTGLVRLASNGVLGAKSVSRNASTQAWPVPTHAELHLQLDAAARPQRVTLLNSLGRPVLTQQAPATALTLNTATLAPGVYVLRVDYAGGLTTQRIVIE